MGAAQVTHTPNDLTPKQRQAAAELLSERPLVYPGTRVIVDSAQRIQYYTLVSTTMMSLRITPQKVNAFCDLCGIPD